MFVQWSDFTSKLVYGLGFGTPKNYIAPLDKINHALVNLNLSFNWTWNRAIMSLFYILGVFSEKPYSEPLEHNIVYIQIITLSYMTSHD